jgi:hypothetical protein
VVEVERIGKTVMIGEAGMKMCRCFNFGAGKQMDWSPFAVVRLN